MRTLEYSFAVQYLDNPRLEERRLIARIEIMGKETKEFFFIKMNYDRPADNPQVGTFSEFNEIEEEMIELLIDKNNNVKLYFCNKMKNISQENKQVMAGAFEEPKKFFKTHFVEDYKEFCHKYKLLIDK